MKILKDIPQKIKLNLYKISALIIISTVFVDNLLAQGPPPPPTPTPIGGGVIALIAGAVGYGAKKLYDNKKQK